MKPAPFLTIFPSFENHEVVTRTLPSVLEESARHGAAVIVHDSSVERREQKWRYLHDLRREYDFFLLLSDNLSMASARNMCLHLACELYLPRSICMIEDDHGYRPGFIPAMMEAMERYYGERAPNNLRYGLFTGCGKHFYVERDRLPEGHACPRAGGDTQWLGGTNSCCRCAPTAHWLTVLKGYDTDEYLISTYQTRPLKLRNYHRGFTAMIVGDGAHMFDIEAEGRGVTSPHALPLWDEEYTASDPRSRYRGKEGTGVDAAGTSGVPIVASGMGGTTERETIATGATEGGSTNGAVEAALPSALVTGEAAYEQGDPITACRCFLAALEENPRSIRAWNDLGVALSSIGELAGAREALARARDLAPEDRITRENQERLALVEAGGAAGRAP